MLWRNVAVNAAMFAAAIGIDTGIEAEVRTVVPGDDADALVAEKLGARQRILGGIPVGIRFELNSLKPVNRIAQGAPVGGDQ